ncbi:MAG: pseudouridine synthase [Longimicrobiaceae bacterium]
MPRPDKHPHAEEVRLQAFLAHSGVASRRAAEELIAAGQVFVNGKSVTAPGTKIRPGVDEVEVQGRPVEVQPPTWLALHKPKGYVTTRLDPYGRKTVYELIPEKYHGLFHVGRLDRDSEGLLLLTNQGDLANRMLHPSFGVTKEYWADVEGKPTAEEMHRLTEGVEADGEVMHAESVRRLHQTAENQHRLSVVMREGKKREVRRMLEAIGHPVARLIRRRFGPVSIGELKPGKWRVLAEAELAALRDPAKRPSRSARLHSGDEDAGEPAAHGGERRPQRKPKPGERAAAGDGAGKSAGGAGASPRPSERRLKARDDAPRGRPADGKPRHGPRERDERPFHERGAQGPVKRGGPVKRVRDGDDRPASASRGPVKRIREDEDRPAAASRGPVKRARNDERPAGRSRGAPARGGPVKRVRDGDDRPAGVSRGAPARSGPVKRVRDGDDRPAGVSRGAPARSGPGKRVREGDERPATPGARDREGARGPSPREASRGFPRSGRAKAGGAARPQGGARPGSGDDDREMESSYPQTRRGSARPSPRGGAPDERRGAPDRPRTGHARGPDDRPGRGGGKPPRGGKDAPRPHDRDRDDDAAPRHDSPRGGGGRPRAGKGPGGPPKRPGGGGRPGGARGPGGPRKGGPRKGGGPRGRS